MSVLSLDLINKILLFVSSAESDMIKELIALAKLRGFDPDGVDDFFFLRVKPLRMRNKGEFSMFCSECHCKLHGNLYITSKLKEIKMNEEFGWMKFLTPVCRDCDKL